MALSATKSENMAPWFLVLCLVKCIQCSNDLAYITEEAFTEAKNSGENFAVYLLSQSDSQDKKVQNVLNSIQLSEGDLKEHNISLKLLNCGKAKLPLCQKSEKLNHVVVYKSSEIVASINGDDLGTTLAVQAYMKHYVSLEKVQVVVNKKEYEDIQKRYSRKSDLMIFYIPALGTIEHLRMVNRAMKLPTRITLLYTSNMTLFNDENIVWYANCLLAQDNQCPVTFSADTFDSEELKTYIQKSSLVTILPIHHIYPAAVRDMVNKGYDLLILIAGARKLPSAVDLANGVASIIGDGIRTLVVDGTKIFHKNIMSRVGDDKIFALGSPGKMGNPKYLDIGFLESENPDDLIDEFTRAISRKDEVIKPENDQVDEDGVMEPEDEEITEDEGESDYVDEAPEEVQDEPIAFSLHLTRHIRDLYYVDYKTIPRLTDKTYETVTQSSDYAVILFTLEFNSKALATLANFVEIHNAYKEMGKSPLYRVECYNWPDVCQKAMVFATPRMFFYPSESTERIEYSGLWDKLSMKNAMIRYSNPSVIVVRNKEDILPYLPITTRSVVGFFESDEATTEFRKAAETLRKDFQFIEVHGAVAKFVAKQYDVDYEDHRLLAFEHSFPKHKIGTFQEEKDILDFCNEAFAAPELQELTIYSFVEVLRDEKPFLIYFWDTMNGDEKTYNTELKDTIQDVASDGMFADKVLFTWMDSSDQTTGQFVLGTYNHKSQLQKPIVAFFNKKGSVILRSCASENCKIASLTAWLKDCIDEKMEVTYSLSTEEWKPRIEGYNFLEMMKEEGTYPVNQVTDNGANEEESSEPTSRGGRTIGDIIHKHMKTEEKHKAEEKVVKEKPEQKKSPISHSEL